MISEMTGTLVASGWWMGGMMVWMVVFWAAVIVCIAWAARRGCSSWRGEDARSVLDQRFAEGGMSAEEYRKVRAALEGEPFEATGLNSETREGAGS